jgi:hypothetical protein
VTFGAYGDSYYEYLLKQYIQSGKRDTRYKRSYDQAMDGMISLLTRKTEKSQLTFIGKPKKNFPLNFFSSIKK